MVAAIATTEDTITTLMRRSWDIGCLEIREPAFQFVARLGRFHRLTRLRKRLRRLLKRLRGDIGVVVQYRHAHVRLCRRFISALSESEFALKHPRLGVDRAFGLKLHDLVHRFLCSVIPLETDLRLALCQQPVR